MIKTITIDIINDKAMKILQNLEQLQLIRVRREKMLSNTQGVQRFKGAMSKQTRAEIDNQLDELRNGWE